jgi:hypothetical protein
MQAGIGMEFFCRRYFGKRGFDACPTSGSLTPRLSQLDQMSPLIAARSEAGEKLIDPNGRTVAMLRHVIFS